MSVQIDIQIADDIADSIDEPPPSHLLCQWAQAAWQGNETDQPILSLRIVSAAESQQLNYDYRDKNKPTNVLSFPMQMDMDIHLPAELQAELSMPDMLLGDLAICAEIISNEAHQQQKTLYSHWAHMLVHGMLHLQGFDHVEDAQAKDMESLEIKIMHKLGFSDPYLNQANHTEQTSIAEQKT